MKIIVITDVHANLPALQAVLESIRAEGYDAIFHTGDAIAIGPQPAECVETLLNIPKIQFVAGNHEMYFTRGLPTPQPTWMSDGEIQHQRWTHSHLDRFMYSALSEWPLILEHSFEGVKTVFLHYALKTGHQDFQSVIRNTAESNLNSIFALPNADLVFYGHDHRRSDKKEISRYVNPGSLGCYSKAAARYSVAVFKNGQYKIQHYTIPYDDDNLFREFESRSVPEREFIYGAFFGGRFKTG